jgi:tetratricopeptide (TPR) repeat protein
MSKQVPISKFTDTKFNLFLRLERPEEAIIDADKALEFNPTCTKAIVEKGEALYKMGHFENALAQFHRGLRLREDPDIKLGITRCKDEILNTLGNPRREYDVAIVKQVIQEMNGLKIKKKSATAMDQHKWKEKIKPRKALGKVNLTLGKMNDDVEFLQKFVEIQKNQPMKTKFSLRFELFHKFD